MNKEKWNFRVECGNENCIEIKNKKLPASSVIPAQAGIHKSRMKTGFQPALE